ncbi:hypothetical protein CBL_05546 [Carabus blaptoides fortunei]
MCASMSVFIGASRRRGTGVVDTYKEITQCLWSNAVIVHREAFKCDRKEHDAMNQPRHHWLKNTPVNTTSSRDLRWRNRKNYLLNLLCTPSLKLFAKTLLVIHDLRIMSQNYHIVDLLHPHLFDEEQCQCDRCWNNFWN